MPCSKLHIQHHYSSVTLSFVYADLLLQKHLLLLSSSTMKSVMLLIIFVETMKHNIYLKHAIFCTIIMYIFIVTFDQFNVSLLNKNISFFQKTMLLTPNFWTSNRLQHPATVCRKTHKPHLFSFFFLELSAHRLNILNFFMTFSPPVW